LENGMKKLVIHIYHVHENAALTGAKLAERIRQVAGERGIELELFIFGAAIGSLADTDQTEFRVALMALAKAGVPVHVCQQAVEAIGQAEVFRQLGFGLEFARDAFIRFAVEGATVISL
jgi:intracellular sulfur oxidation DsrE/DsrF family protein